MLWECKRCGGRIRVKGVDGYICAECGKKTVSDSNLIQTKEVKKFYVPAYVNRARVR